jgi:hypothetical protein
MAAAGLTVGLAGCSDGGTTGTDGQADGAVAEAAFTASLSDDGSIPGHEASDSEGTGEASLEGTDGARLEFSVSWEGLEGEVTGVHIHGDGSADGGYLVRLFEPTDSDNADGAVVTGDRMESGSVSASIVDDHVNPSGDYDGDIETVTALVAELESPELGESGGVINIHTGYAPDSELAGQVTVE